MEIGSIFVQAFVLGDVIVFIIKLHYCHGSRVCTHLLEHQKQFKARLYLFDPFQIFFARALCWTKPGPFPSAF